MSLSPITQAELDALRVTFDLLFQEAYGSTPTFYDKIATEVPSGGHSNVYGWSAQRTRLRHWIGPRVANNMSEHVQTVVNLPFEGTIELDKNRLDDDRNTIGVFARTALVELANAVAKHPDQLLKNRLQNANPLAANPVLSFDGLSFFNDAHPTFAPNGSPQTYDNNFTGAALDATNLDLVYQTMVSYVGENGDPLGVMPNALIVPPQLRRVASELMHSSTYAQSNGVGAGNVAVDNPMVGWLDVIVIPELANEPTTWYVADLSKPVKPWVFQRRSAATMVARDQLTDPKVFDEGILTYGADYRGNVGPALPFLMSRAIA